MCLGVFSVFMVGFSVFRVWDISGLGCSGFRVWSF